MGCMTLTQDLARSSVSGARVIAAAIDAGVTLFDTADSYGPTGEMGVNEVALAAANREVPGAAEAMIVATKGGHTRGPNATWWIDGTPEHLAAAARASRARLGVEAIALYQHHRPDPRVPYGDSMAALRQLVDDGVVQRLGVSNVSLPQLEIASDILGSALVSVQNECSLTELSSIPVLDRCADLGLAFLAWGPLGGMREAKAQASGVGAVSRIAAAHGVSPQRIALAWLRTLSPAMIPIPGASRAASIIDSAAAIEVVLSPAEVGLIDSATGHSRPRSAEGSD